MDFSPGLDFETKIVAKPDAALLLEKELNRPSYKPEPIALGANTDAYQPVERKMKITRGVLEVLSSHNHPVIIITKSALIERDIDLLEPMATKNLVKVIVSVTSLDHHLSRHLEPRAASPKRRLQIINKLTVANIPVGILFAPIIPILNDNEMESVLSDCANSGAISAAYVLLRLPMEVKTLFEQWLQQHYPLKHKHVMNCLSELRDGKVNSAKFGERMSGTGVYADIISQRFRLACKHNNLNTDEIQLNTQQFRAPQTVGVQLDLFS